MLWFSSLGEDVKKVNFSNWLQVGANLGILAGLIIVGFQMKQASDLQKMQIFRDETSAYMANEISLAGEDFAAVWAKSIESPETLTLKELKIMDSYLWGHYVYRWMGQYRLHEMGLLDDVEWKREIKVDVPVAFGSPFGKAWWQNFKDHLTLDENAIWFTPEFINYISQQAEAVPDTWTAGNIMGPLEHLKPSTSSEVTP